MKGERESVEKKEISRSGRNTGLKGEWIEVTMINIFCTWIKYNETRHYIKLIYANKSTFKWMKSEQFSFQVQ